MDLPTDGSLARIIKSAKSNKFSSEYNTNQTKHMENNWYKTQRKKYCTIQTEHANMRQGSFGWTK